MLAKADADQDTWDEIATNVVNLSLPDVSAPGNAAMDEVPDAAINQLAINTMYRGLLNIFSPVATSTSNQLFTDPMLQVQRQGTILSMTGTAALGAGVVLEVGNDSLIGKGIDFFFGTGDVVSAVSGSLMAAGFTLIITGFIMIIILPLVPLMYFFTGILSWLLQILELMFCDPSGDPAVVHTLSGSNADWRFLKGAARDFRGLHASVLHDCRPDHRDDGHLCDAFRSASVFWSPNVL